MSYLLFKPRMFLFIIIIIILTVGVSVKPIRSGTVFEIECPFKGVKKIPNIRTYGLVLNNAQKNMQISIHQNKQYQQTQISLIKNKKLSNTKNSKQSKFLDQKQQQDRKQNEFSCILNKNNKVCLFDGFSSELNFQCSTSGSVSLLIIEPIVVTEIGQDEPLRQQAIAPILAPGQKGVAVFKPDGNIQAQKLKLSQLFLSNCIKNIQYFEYQILIGIQGSTGIQIIVNSEGMAGSWTFKKTQKILLKDLHLHTIKSYNTQNQLQTFQVIRNKIDKTNSQIYYHGFKMLLKSQNRQNISKLSLIFNITLNINDPIIAEQQSLNRTFVIQSGELQGNIPIKLAFYFSQHPIQKISILSTQTIHYNLQLSQPKQSQIQNKLPTIQQNQYLFYSYQRISNQHLLIQAHIQKSFKTKSTPMLRIISSGIKQITGHLKQQQNIINKQQKNLKINSQESQKQKQNNKILIQNNKILPLTIKDNNKPYADIQLQIKVQQTRKQKSLKSKQKNNLNLYFKLFLQTSFIPLQIQVGVQIKQFVFENQIKRFKVPRANMLALKSKKLIIKCDQCHAFLTYDPNCKQISCCQKAHAQQIDVRPTDLLIFITAASHLTQTALVKLSIIQGDKQYKIKGGQVIQSTLLQSDTYIYQIDKQKYNNQDIQIICNSQTQSILLLVSISNNQFPTKTSFDYQSNQGYIRISAIKIKNNNVIYIRLLKMTTSYTQSEYTLYSNSNKNKNNYKLAYSLIVASQSQGIKLNQGKAIKNVIMKNGSKQYVIQHICNNININNNNNQPLYLKVNRLNHLNNNIGNLGNNGNNGNGNINKKLAVFKIQIKNKDSQKILYSQDANQEGIIQFTKFLVKNKTKNNKTNKQINHILSNETQQAKQNICELIIILKNLIPQTFSVSMMFFKQKQSYQIIAGQFTVDHLLTNHGLLLYCVIDPYRATNVYVYSMKQQIIIKSILLQISQLKYINEILQIQFLNKTFNINKNINNGIVYKKIQQKLSIIPSYSHYQYFKPPHQKMINKNKNLSVMIILINKTDVIYNNNNYNFERKDIFIICTQNQTVMRQGNRLHYNLKNQQTHHFHYPLSQIFLLDKKQSNSNSKSNQNQIWKINNNYYTNSYNYNTYNDKQIIIQTTKLNGIHTIQVSLKYYGQLIYKFELKKQTNQIKSSNKIITQHLANQHQPILIIKSDMIRKKLQQIIQNQKQGNFNFNIEDSDDKQNSNINNKQKNDKNKNKQNNSIQNLLKGIHKLQQIQFNNLQLQFQVTCHNNYKLTTTTNNNNNNNNKQCTFLTSIQTSQSDIRQLTPGVPQIFHINKHSSIIFIYNNNLHDREFKFKVNRKQGLPNYKLCSFRPLSSLKYNNNNNNIDNRKSLTKDGKNKQNLNIINNNNIYDEQFSNNNNKDSQDKCLMELQTPLDQYLMIQQNAFNIDSNLIVGRTHQLIINQYNQQYCTNCTYYLGLYSGYDVVQGSIFVMSANQPTLLQQASSITTIVYRGQPDKYVINNWMSLMAIIYQIQGKVNVEVYGIDRKGNKIVVIKNNMEINKSNKKYERQIEVQNKDKNKNKQQNINSNSNQKIIAINLNTINIQKQQQQQLSSYKFYINVQPAHNSPSALYTLIVMSKQQHIINIKDGVPYQMKYNDNYYNKDNNNNNNKQLEKQKQLPNNINNVNDSNMNGKINPIIKYRYKCQAQGVVMISTRDFDDIDIQVRCFDQQQYVYNTKNNIYNNYDTNMNKNNKYNTNLNKQNDQNNKQDATNNNNDNTYDKVKQSHIKLQQSQKSRIISIQQLLATKKSYKMSNRLNFNINPQICTLYQFSITAKTPTTAYSILVSSTDIITLPMHKQVPGILKYQTKLYQIYQVSVSEKTQIRCTFKFCQGGDGRIMIANNKKKLYQQIYQQQLQIYEQTTYQTLLYMARPGLFYIKVQFKGRGGIVQYTIHVQSTSQSQLQSQSQSQSQGTYIPYSQLYTSQSNTQMRIYKNMNAVNYKVIRIGYNYTEYQIQFYPIIQQNQDMYQIQYYIVQSTKFKLLKKTQNCNGQYFVQFVNHHQQIKQTKININQKVQNNQNTHIQQQDNNKQNTNLQQNNKQLSQQQKQQLQQQKYQKQQSVIDSKKLIKFQYSTSTSYTFITIIPIIYNKKTHQFYHLYIPKYQQVQLKNGQIFAGLTFLLGEIASKIQLFIDIHGSQKAIFIILGIFVIGCMCTLLLGGIWLGANYFMKTKKIYVFKQLKQQQSTNEIEQVQDNNNSNALGMMILQQNSNMQNNIQENQNNNQNIQQNNINIENNDNNSYEIDNEIVINNDSNINMNIIINTNTTNNNSLQNNINIADNNLNDYNTININKINILNNQNQQNYIINQNKQQVSQQILSSPKYIGMIQKKQNQVQENSIQIQKKQQQKQIQNQNNKQIVQQNQQVQNKCKKYQKQELQQSN